MTDPRLILLDEPANGLTHDEVDDLAKILRDVRARRGISMVLVEHHMGLVMSLCDRIVVLDFGHNISEGTPQHVASDPLVLEAYMGAEVS